MTCGDHDDSGTITFRQLTLFESIGRLRSVRKASEECNLSQPAVTQAIAKLERRVGAALFERRNSGSYLNNAGQLFLERTKRFFQQTEDALVDLGVSGGTNGAKAIAARLSRTQIRCLVATVDHLSIANAAAALGLSRNSLQRSLRDLEGNLRKSLFHRSGAGMLAGPQSVEFGRRMKLALQEIEWGVREIEAAQGGFLTELSIGGMPYGGSILLASAFDEFTQTYPLVGVRATIENAPSMRRSLGCGDVDLVVGLLPARPQPDLISEAFANTPYSIVGRLRHPLLNKNHITIDDLLAYDWIVGTDGSNRRACFEHIFQGRRPRAPISTCALPGLHRLLAGSERLTLMTSYELAQENGRLATIPFQPIKHVPALGITMRADWLPTKMHRALIDIIRRKTIDATRNTMLREVAC